MVQRRQWFELRKLAGDGGPSLPEADREQVLLVVRKQLRHPKGVSSNRGVWLHGRLYRPVVGH